MWFFLQVSVSSMNEISGIDILYGWLFSLLGKISDWNMSDWWETAKREKKIQGWPVRVILWENSFLTWSYRCAVLSSGYYNSFLYTWCRMSLLLIDNNYLQKGIEFFPGRVTFKLLIGVHTFILSRVYRYLKNKFRFNKDFSPHYAGQLYHPD